MQLLQRLKDDPLFKHALSLLSDTERESTSAYVEGFVRELDEELERLQQLSLVTLEPNTSGSMEPVESGER